MKHCDNSLSPYVSRSRGEQQVHMADMCNKIIVSKKPISSLSNNLSPIHRQYVLHTTTAPWLG